MKVYTLITIILISFFSYLLILVIPREYEITYQIDNYKVEESYNKSIKYYQFLIESNNEIYPLIVEQKYSSNRKLIEKISLSNEEDITCLFVTINNKEYPICRDKEGLKSIYTLQTDFIREYLKDTPKYNTEAKDSFESTKIYNLLNNKYFIWNYKGYDYISKNQKERITIINKDDYNNNLAYQYKNYIITPNYDSEYFFNELLILNTKKIELSSYQFKDKIEIAYDAYFLGDHKKNIYLVDKKNKTQYEININKKNIEIIGTKEKNGIWYNDGWEEISLIKLINSEYKFYESSVHNFIVDNENLYLKINDYKILLSNLNVKDIVKIEKDKVYYIVQNSLYMFSEQTGEVKLLENSEWDFNHRNKIFIFEE